MVTTWLSQIHQMKSHHKAHTRNGIYLCTETVVSSVLAELLAAHSAGKFNIVLQTEYLM